ncbi:MAG: Hsp20/alpha crystallin family protein [Halospina sp.]
MDLKKISPWNWFRKEQEQAREQQDLNAVPATREGRSQAVSRDPVMNLHNRMDQLFDDFYRQFGLSPWPALGSGLTEDFFRPSVDIKESEDNYTLHVDMPGVEKDDVKVEVDGDALIIRGEKQQERDDSDDNYHFVERRYGAFQRILDLPADAKADDLKAKFRNGVLTITIGRDAEQSGGTRRIEVE